MIRNLCVLALTSLMLLGFANPGAAQFGDPVPRQPQQMDGPVNMANGRKLFLTATDINIPARGLDLNFARYYNADGATRSTTGASYMGPKWSHTYQWEVKTSGSRPHTTTVGGIWVYGFYYYVNGVEHWKNGYWLEEPTTVSRPNTLQYHVVTGSGSTLSFTTSGSSLSSSGWEGRIKCHPKTGVRGALKLVANGTKWAYEYTTSGGTVYRFTEPEGVTTNRRVLTKITDRNGNSLALHYETGPEATTSASKYPRLIAVEDELNRFLKFTYRDPTNEIDKNYDRAIQHVLFGKGTAQKLTTRYQRFDYVYSATSSGYPLITAQQWLNAGEARADRIKTGYEYKGNSHYVNAVVTPLGNRHEFELSGGGVNRVKITKPANLGGAVLFNRNYSGATVYNTTATHSASNKRREVGYTASGRKITRVQTFYKKPGAAAQSSVEDRWQYSGGNISKAYHRDVSANTYKWYYKLYYEGADAAHNKRMGNVTKWEQIDPANPTAATPTVLRTWTADYETTFNLPLWQINPMGHKTTFSYDTKGNLTESRSKANTGSQPVAVDHDIITTFEYDSYGNPTKTTFMPGTSEEKVTETVYDSTHHTYPIEVKTTVTVDGTKTTIKTKSEWDVDRGLKTADIDAMGKRTEYDYWQDRALKYSKRAADSVYYVPTHDKEGNLTQTQVRKTNWQTGTLLAQSKTEYDGMGRSVKSHGYKDNWTTPYATTQVVYDIYGDVSQRKDARNLITNFTLDDLGRVTKTTLPDGDWVETRYNSLGQVTKSWSSASGSEASPATSYTYDAKYNRMTQASYKSGESVSYTYDKGGNTLTQTTNDGTNTYKYTFTHDQLNRLKTWTNAHLGYKTFYEYDDASMRTRMYIQPTAGGANVYDVNYTYNEAGRMLTVKDALANKTASYAYFDNGVIKTATLPNGITAHRTLDTLNRLDTLKYKKSDGTTLLASLDYTYDDRSNVTQLVRDDTGAGGSSKTYTFGYDNVRRLTSANYGDETVSYTYDNANNRLTQVSSVDGTTTYTIAANSNQLNRRSLVPEDSDFATMSYTYDAEGNLTKRHEGNDSDGFTYGFGGQLKQVEKIRGGTKQSRRAWNYDGSGNRVEAISHTYGSQPTSRYFLYDGGMPVLELNAQKKVEYAYLYGADGVVYRRKFIPGSAVARWRFDDASGTALTDEVGDNDGTLGGGTATKEPAWSTENGGSLHFDGTDDLVKVADSDGLDMVGNTLTISGWVKRDTQTSGNLVKKADASNGYRLWITAAGNLQFEILKAGTTHTLTSAQTIPLNAWTHVSARYNSHKMRIFIAGVRDTAFTDVVTTFVATTEPLYLGYHDGTSHHFDGYLSNLAIYKIALSGDHIIQLSRGETGMYEYHHANARGSTILTTDGAENAGTRYEYDAFGEVRSQTGTSGNTRKFTGKEYDDYARLYYHGARYYDPYVGRFTTRDPVGDGSNWYAYALNNPLAFIDPDGLRPVNGIEMLALEHTFGTETAVYLSTFLDVVIDPSLDGKAGGRVKDNRTIYLSTNYETVGQNGNRLPQLSVFIHEATHIWQRRTGLHREGKGGEDYVYTIQQLLDNDLKIEEHAEAVEKWFYVDFGLKMGWIGVPNPKNPNDIVQVAYNGAWSQLYKGLGYEDPHKTFDLQQSFFHDPKTLQRHVDVIYKAVVDELRTTKLTAEPISVVIPKITIRAF